jgi:hypothetical protein
MYERSDAYQKMKGNSSRKVKPLHIGAAVAGVFVVIIAAVVAFNFGISKQSEPAAPATGGRGVVAVPENVEELRKKAQQPVEDGYYETRMNVEWVFPSSSEPSANAYVENSTNNKRTVYFDLILSDTNERIYSSPYIPVGAKLEQFALDAKVPAGEYAGVVTYHLVDDDYQELTTVSVGVTLKIER